mmetsp:Transcript_612/g.2238  ORF Transcript_612/g.2238 Transcript_612/m.2238 type:complete len:86 (+) Transcript_612:1925-2182(+)
MGLTEQQFCGAKSLLIIRSSHLRVRTVIGRRSGILCKNMQKLRCKSAYFLSGLEMKVLIPAGYVGVIILTIVRPLPPVGKEVNWL